MARILVLDDVRDMGEMLGRILSRAGHTPEVFTEEEEALEHAGKTRPEAAILDIKLKRMTGVEFLAELKKRSPETRVMMLTGYPTLGTARDCARLGAMAYCVKPVDRDELLAKLADMLERPGETP